eukprot:scaffold3378_cov93-Isochrysis_galbana.AAC.5
MCARLKRNGRARLALGLFDGGDNVVHGLCVGNGVADANGVGAVQDPVVDQALVAADEGAHSLRAEEAARA